MTTYDSFNGTFQYPPNGNKLVFNFLDTVNVNWEVGQENSTACYLSLYYWPNSNPWEISYNQTVPCNGTQPVELNVASQWYLGQFNLNYTRSDGRNGLVLSEFFDVNYDPSSEPETWPLQNPTAASSSASNSLMVITYTIMASTPLSSSTSSQSIRSPSLYSVLSSSPLPSSPSTPSPSPSGSSGLSHAAVIGVSVGVGVGVPLIIGLTAALVFFLWKRNRLAAANGTSGASAYGINYNDEAAKQDMSSSRNVHTTGSSQ